MLNIHKGWVLKITKVEKQHVQIILAFLVNFWQKTRFTKKKKFVLIPLNGKKYSTYISGINRYHWEVPKTYLPNTNHRYMRIIFVIGWWFFAYHNKGSLCSAFYTETLSSLFCFVDSIKDPRFGWSIIFDISCLIIRIH